MLEPPRRSSDKTGPHLSSSSEKTHSEVGPSQLTELRSSQDKLAGPLELDPCANSISRSFGQTDTSSFAENCSSSNKISQLEFAHNSDQGHQNRAISSPPLSPEVQRGLRLEMSPKMQATLTSALSNIAAAPVTGYYTSRAAASGLTNIESEEEESSNKDEKQGLTLLPTNFPTFESTASLISSLTSLQSLPSKPTAVVSPSRPRLPMPILPKPVPAAITSSPVKVEKVPVLEPGYVCRQCPQGFPSRESLLSHQLTAHPWS